MSTFEEWTGGASESEIREMIKVLRKNYYKWLLISLIPIINIFTMGNAIFCYNNLNYMKSRGRTQGSVLWRWIMIIYGLILPPIIAVPILANSEKLSAKVLWS